MKRVAIALVGDFSADVVAHDAIPRALNLVAAQIGSSINLTWTWVGTRGLTAAKTNLAPFHAIWVVPASPYENMQGALEAIRFARESGRPFLGTCGGFQHALIELARNVAGVATADHAETNPTGNALVVTPLTCSLVGKTGTVRFTPGSLLATAYRRDHANEGYHCNYGPSRGYRSILEQTGLRFTAFDDAGEFRAGELPPNIHPFFVGTLFQPERAALRAEVPPLVSAFVAAAIKRATSLAA